MSKFKEALQRAKKAEESSEHDSSFSSFETFPTGKEYMESAPRFAPGKASTATCFRLLGLPFEIREEPTDCKALLVSKIVSDKGTYSIPIYWKIKENSEKVIPDPDWILTRLYNEVMSGEWRDATAEEIAEAQAKGRTRRKTLDHFHEGSSVYRRVKNNSATNAKFSSKFFPATRVVANVIDRSDMDWHTESKLSKVLCASVGSKEQDDGSTRYYPELGLPHTVYMQMLELAGDAAEDDGWNFDFILRKVNQNDRINYFVNFGTSREVAASIKEIGVKPQDGILGIEDSLTLHNLDELFRVTNYGTLKAQFGNLFKDWQEYAQANRSSFPELSNHIYEELCDLASDEMAANRAANAEGKVQQQEIDKKVEVAVKDKEAVEPKRARATRKVVETTTTETKGETPEEKFQRQLSEYFPAFADIAEEEQDYIIVDLIEGFNDDGSVRWNSKDSQGNKIDLVGCPEDGSCKGDCDREAPNTLRNCPYCGIVFS